MDTIPSSRPHRTSRWQEQRLIPFVASGLTLLGASVTSEAIACTAATSADVAAWHSRLSAAHEFRGTIREFSRSTNVEKSDDPQIGDAITTTVVGNVIDSKGRHQATVSYVETNEILCRWGNNPLNGQTGVVYAERSANGEFLAIDFRENRKH